MQSPTIVGEGTYGCVHKPPMKCKNKDINTDPTLASKLMKNTDAFKEMTEFKLIEETDKQQNFHLGKPILCRVDNTPSNKKAMMKCKNNKYDTGNIDNYSLLLLKYGGLDLDKYAKMMKETKLTTSNYRRVENFWIDMSRILYGLTVFSDSGIVHHDLKHQNIVYNEDTGRANFIDFGLMTTKTRIANAAKASRYGFTNLHWSFPMEITLLNNDKFKYVIKNTQPGDSVLSKGSTLFKYLESTITEMEEKHNYLFNCIATTGNKPVDVNEVKKYFTDFIQMVRSLRVDNYNELLNACIDTIDIYGTGIGLLYVLRRTKRFLQPALYADLNILFKSMTNANVFQRIKPAEALSKYEHILLSNGILEKYNMHFKDHILVEGSPLTPAIHDILEHTLGADLTMSQKEREQFVKSIVIQCPPGKDLNPITRRCNKSCKPGFIRDEQFKCKKDKQIKQDTASTTKSAKKCPSGKERNPKTGRCNKTCKRGYKRNAEFKCVKEK